MLGKSENFQKLGGCAPPPFPVVATSLTALHVASYRGHEKIVELLLEKGACLTTKNKYDLTPVDKAKTDQIKK